MGRAQDERSSMFGKLGRPSHATVVAYAALFIALGGVSYAVITLPKNSVGSKQIKRGAVKNSDIAPGAVTGIKVKDGSLFSADFAPGQLPERGPQGLGAVAFKDASPPETGLRKTVYSGPDFVIQVRCNEVFAILALVPKVNLNYDSEWAAAPLEGASPVRHHLMDGGTLNPTDPNAFGYVALVGNGERAVSTVTVEGASGISIITASIANIADAGCVTRGAVIPAS